jgi:hypothetical protein
VRIEIVTALKHEKVIIPAPVGGAAMPPPNQLPDAFRELAARNFVVLQEFGWEYGIDYLVK